MSKQDVLKLSEQLSAWGVKYISGWWVTIFLFDGCPGAAEHNQVLQVKHENPLLLWLRPRLN